MLQYFFSFFSSSSNHHMTTRSQTQTPPIQIEIESTSHSDSEPDDNNKPSLIHLKSVIDEEYFNQNESLQEYRLPIKKRRQKLNSYLNVYKKPYATRYQKKKEQEDNISVHSEETVMTEVTYDCFEERPPIKYNLRNRKHLKSSFNDTIYES